MEITHQGIITLLRSGVTGENLPLPEGFVPEEAFEILRRQAVVPIAYEGAVHCGIDRNHPVMQKMLMLCYQNLMKHELQTQSVNRIFAAFEDLGIPYMPVKGCNMKRIYPKPEMRAMGDVDILIHPQDHGRIQPIMEELGFTYRIENDHVFEWHAKELHVELHKSLVPPNDEDYFSYYGSGWKLAVKGAGYRHDLSAEDAYIFMFTHFARHYRHGGIGCRHVVDLFVYLRAHPALNRDYIAKELAALHLTQFHENVLQTLNVWFLGEEGNEITELITAFIFSGGSWGRLEAVLASKELKNARRKGSVRNSQIKAVLHAIFPPRAELRNRYQILRNYPFLFPVMWVVRWFDILFFRPKNIRKKLGVLEILDDKKIRSHQQALEAVGLDFTFK